ncbi:MAG: hypothetical protein PHT97_11175 [Methanoculleus sp.]|jgi:hypothetical protein|uniref:hypothetical protein n=1 Tax=Methanoculleus sp. TaxID=90427 RepID=UPI0026091222|nr:hypothetical protein [Methanoculleus sp.]MDD2254784.1 hypothetical protein [Methanoculleus sp.]MDD4471704.1 hypothetical protein [Methanoculleus sp.]
MQSDERQGKSLMKVGAGLVIFGIVCPFFWLSLFSGNSPQETWVYGIHSGAIVVLGLGLLGKGWYDLKCLRTGRETKNS